jgi:hypothetical protein
VEKSDLMERDLNSKRHNMAEIVDLMTKWQKTVEDVNSVIYRGSKTFVPWPLTQSSEKKKLRLSGH